MRELAIQIPILLPLCLILLAFALPFLTAFPTQHWARSPRTTGLGPTLDLGLAILAFVAVLFSYWASGRSHHVLLGSLLPWNDAIGYFFGAHHLLDSGELSAWSHRRPLYTSLLAGFLSLGGRDLQLALLVQTVLTGAVAFFAAQAAAARMGPAAGFLIFALLLAFAGEYAPATMTENAGFLFGALGIALLWLKAERRSPAWFAAAGFLLMLGLLARAGAFFVIPFLLLWAWSAFRDDQRAALRCTLALLGGALLAVLLNQGIYWYAGTGDNVPFSNFSYTFYGLAVGGKGWLQVYADYPEGMTTYKMFALAFEKIAENPFNIVIGYVRNLPHSTLRLFDYAPAFLPVRPLLGIFWLAGLFVAFRRRREPLALFLLMATAGIVLSGPFLSDVGSRIFAATIPIDAYLAGLGFSAILARLSRSPKPTEPASTTPSGLSAQLIGTGSVLVLLTLAGSFILPRPQVGTLPAFAWAIIYLTNTPGAIRAYRAQLAALNLLLFRLRLRFRDLLQNAIKHGFIFAALCLARGPNEALRLRGTRFFWLPAHVELLKSSSGLLAIGLQIVRLWPATLPVSGNRPRLFRPLLSSNV